MSGALNVIAWPIMTGWKYVQEGMCHYGSGESDMIFWEEKPLTVTRVYLLCRPLWGREWMYMYLLYPKNPTCWWLRATSRSEKYPSFFNDCAICELRMRAWNWNVTDSKKTILDLLTPPPRYFPLRQSNEMSHDFVRGYSVAETCFSHWG